MAASGLTALSYDLDRVGLASTSTGASFLTSAALACFGLSAFYFFGGETDGLSDSIGKADLTGDGSISDLAGVGLVALTGDGLISDLAGVGLIALTGEGLTSDLAGVDLVTLAGVFFGSDFSGEDFRSDLVTDFLETDFLLTLFFTELLRGERPRSSSTCGILTT